MDRLREGPNSCFLPSISWFMWRQPCWCQHQRDPAFWATRRRADQRGSVNQAGEIQAIGGVTQKVEGWFNVCREQGLTGEQGVMIPAANVQDLMLRVSVVKAVEEGQFHIWAVSNVDEGLEVLTGQPASDVHAAAKFRLQELAQTMERFRES